MAKASQKVYIVFNPTAGKDVSIDVVQESLNRHLSPPDWDVEIYQTTGKEDVPALCRKACKDGASIVVSAGGDGTAVGVANGLVGQAVPLGLLPLGTGNDLARVLGVPLKLDDAVKLLAEDHGIIEVDALKVGDRYFFSNVSVGMSPRMMKDTSSEEKKRFGRLAYFWTLIRKASIFQVHRFTVTIDGQPRRVRASEVLISNTTLLAKPPAFFGPPEDLVDGQLDTYLVSAETPGDYLQLIWDLFRRPGWSASKLQHWVGKKRVRIDADRRTQIVQADGEVIGQTPVEIELVSRALRVIMPGTPPVPAASDDDMKVAPGKAGKRDPAKKPAPTTR